MTDDVAGCGGGGLVVVVANRCVPCLHCNRLVDVLCATLVVVAAAAAVFVVVRVQKSLICLLCVTVCVSLQMVAPALEPALLVGVARSVADVAVVVGGGGGGTVRLVDVRRAKVFVAEMVVVWIRWTGIVFVVVVVVVVVAGAWVSSSLLHPKTLLVLVLSLLLSSKTTQPPLGCCLSLFAIVIVVLAIVDISPSNIDCLP